MGKLEEDDPEAWDKRYPNKSPSRASYSVNSYCTGVVRDHKLLREEVEEGAPKWVDGVEIIHPEGCRVVVDDGEYSYVDYSNCPWIYVTEGDGVIGSHVEGWSDRERVEALLPLGVEVEVEWELNSGYDPFTGEFDAEFSWWIPQTGKDDE